VQGCIVGIAQCDGRGSWSHFLQAAEAPEDCRREPPAVTMVETGLPAQSEHGDAAGEHCAEDRPTGTQRELVKCDVPSNARSGPAVSLLVRGGVRPDNRRVTATLIARLDGTIAFHKLPLRPGRRSSAQCSPAASPCSLCRGNPVSTMVTARRFGRQSSGASAACRK